MKDFRNELAVVTGGASGIAEALVRALLAEATKAEAADVEQAEATLTDRAQRYGRAALPIDPATIPQI
ncbi:MAG: hypothetical protein GY733_21845 [bacterium]|nr:hypothetical protein [bacterium]